MRNDFYSKRELVNFIAKEIKKIYAILFKTIIQYIKKWWNTGVSKLRFSLVLRLNASYVLRTISIIFWINILCIGISAYYINEIVKEKITSTSEVIIEELSNSKELNKDNIDIIGRSSGLYLKIYDKDNTVLYSNTDDTDTEIISEITDGYTFEKDSQGDDVISFKKELEGYNYGIRQKVDSEQGELTVVLYDKPYNNYKSLQGPFLMLLAFEGLIILITIHKGAKKTRKILKPIDVMTNTVKKISVDQLDTRLNISGSQNELKDLALTFNEMLDRLQNSYEIQNQFVSDASHELRTPISVIQGYAKLLDRWGKEDEKVLLESIEAIKTEAEDMKDLVEKLLFLARGDKNTQEVKMDNFDLKELMEEVYKETKLIDKEHIINLESSDSIVIKGDRKLLKEMLRIFVDNAVKYTKSGGNVTLGFSKEFTKVNIFISDTGVGISQEDLPNIFNRFYRADKSRTKNTGGTGLGLSIAKWIVMKHRGSIVVESKINEGTKFIIRLPID